MPRVSISRRPTQCWLCGSIPRPRSARSTRCWGLVPRWANDLKLGSRTTRAPRRWGRSRHSATPSKAGCASSGERFLRVKKDGRRQAALRHRTRGRATVRLRRPMGELARQCTWQKRGVDQNMRHHRRANELLVPIHNRMPVMRTDRAEAVYASQARPFHRCHAPERRSWPDPAQSL
jgi:hypothetical protein